MTLGQHCMSLSFAIERKIILIEIIFFDISKGMLKVFEASDNLEPSKMIF